MTTTIIFDLSEVYLHGLLGIEKHLFLKHKLSIKNEELQTEELEKLFHGEITEDEFWRAMKEKFQWRISLQQLKSAIRDNFTQIEGTRAIIETLKQNGYKLGLLSVHAKEWIDHCEKKFDYHKFFDSIIYSFEFAICKPERRAYELMLEKLEVRAQDCIFIDDSKRNLKAAELLKIKTVQFHNADQLKKDLRLFEIKL